MRRVRRVRWALAALLGAWILLSAAPAAALTLDASAHVLATSRVDVSVGATDPVGKALLTVDGAVVVYSWVETAPMTARFDIPLAPGRHEVRFGVRVGHTMQMTPIRYVTSWRVPAGATPVTPKAGGWAGGRTPITVKVDKQTTKASLYLNGKLITKKYPDSQGVVRFGTYGLAAGSNAIRIVCENPVSSSSKTYTVRRLDYPWPTCIVVDKSDYRLFWVRDGVLVKTYPVAIGKRGTPTPARVWRVGIKHYENPAGVYGPRRLRLFRREGSSYVYTNYGIHGTNEPWVIGTMASHGCIRMYNRDILELWPQVPLHTMVLTRE